MISSASTSMSNRAPNALARLLRRASQPSDAVEQFHDHGNATRQQPRRTPTAGSPTRPATSATSAARASVIWLAGPKRENG